MSRDYGKLHATFWTSGTIRGLTSDGVVLAAYLLTCSHGNLAGVFRLPDAYAADDLCWEPQRVAKGFSELSQNGFASRCRKTSWVVIHKFLKWNPPENPNQRKAALKLLGSVPENTEIGSAVARAFTEAGLIEHVEEPEKRKGSETVSKPVTGTVAIQAGTGAASAAPSNHPPGRSTSRSVKVRMPADFAVSERVSTWAAQKGFDRLDEHLESFRRKATANGYSYADWDAAFMEAIREDWAKLRSASGHGRGAPPAEPSQRRLREL